MAISSVKGSKITGFIVTDIKNVDMHKTPDALPVFSLDEVLNNYSDYSIVIGAPKYKSDIIDILKKGGKRKTLFLLKLKSIIRLYMILRFIGHIC